MLGCIGCRADKLCGLRRRPWVPAARPLSRRASTWLTASKWYELREPCVPVLLRHAFERCTDGACRAARRLARRCGALRCEAARALQRCRRLARQACSRGKRGTAQGRGVEHAADAVMRLRVPSGAGPACLCTVGGAGWAGRGCEEQGCERRARGASAAHSWSATCAAAGLVGSADERRLRTVSAASAQCCAGRVRDACAGVRACAHLICSSLKDSNVVHGEICKVRG
jgi:hypothetical protein